MSALYFNVRERIDCRVCVSVCVHVHESVQKAIIVCVCVCVFAAAAAISKQTGDRECERDSMK